MADLFEQAKVKVAARARCKVDKMFLAEQLGYDFQPCHQELFDQFPTYDCEKPWAEQSDILDRMILWARGHYKSTAVVVEIIQIILNFPNIRILIMQGSLRVTQNLLKEIRSHFLGEAEGSKLSELFPEYCGIKRQLGSHPLMEMTTPARTRHQLQQATVTCASPRSVKTGQHYDAGFFDDLVNDQNYSNPKLLDKIREDFTLAQSLIDPGGTRTVSGTRYAFGDLYEEILRWKKEGSKWIISIATCWKGDDQKARVPRFPQFTKKNGELGGFTREGLEQMERDDPAMFACQQLQSPVHNTLVTISESQMLAACIAANDAPHMTPPVLCVDLASTNNDRSDDSVILCGRADSLGIVYITDMRGDTWIPNDLATNIIAMILKHRPVVIYFEKTASCVYFVEYLRLTARQMNINLPTVEFIKVDNKDDAKNLRVLSWASSVKRGRVKFFAGLSKFDRLIAQAITFPKGKYGHDDWPDTAALLWQQLSKAFLSLPYRPAAKNPILAMIQDRENTLIKMMEANELQIESHDTTGLD